MNEEFFTGTLFLILFLVALFGTIIRILLRPHREPSSRIAWLVVIIALPVAGIVAYLLLGETNIGRRRVERMQKIIARLPNMRDISSGQEDIPANYAPLFQAGETVNDFKAVGGNRGHLMDDSNSTINTIVNDIDAAKEHVHLMFYIWLADNNGLKIVAALKRAASRGVSCRAMADGLGSRTIIDSTHWKNMSDAGVLLAVALPIGNPILRSIKGRIDLRNHRKIVIIDNSITYCGSQNCADPEFLVKAKYAPWVDAMIRFEGPIARQNQYLFACDWEFETGENISSLLSQALPEPSKNGLPAQVIGTGPTVRYSAMPEIFETLMYAARQELIITTPYYVPDESMQAALCACARRGVKTSIIFPAKNDSWIVGAASHSYYRDLLAAGVRIFEFQGGLLHTKSLTLDGKVTLIGSANMDRRSFELNYENNILFCDEALSAEMRQRQEEYISSATLVTMEMVEEWSWRQQLWNNAIAMLGPVL